MGITEIRGGAGKWRVHSRASPNCPPHSPTVELVRRIQSVWWRTFGRSRTPKHWCGQQGLSPTVTRKFLSALRAKGNCGPSLERLIAELGLVDRVVLPGRVTDVAEFLKDIDVGVLCSRSEGSSNALLEYMAAGRAIVATAVGGTPQLIEDGVHGLLVSPGDPAGWRRPSCNYWTTRRTRFASAPRRVAGSRTVSTNVVGRHDSRRFTANC